jgi:hypothetical protein
VVATAAEDRLNNLADFAYSVCGAIGVSNLYFVKGEGDPPPEFPPPPPPICDSALTDHPPMTCSRSSAVSSSSLACLLAASGIDCGGHNSPPSWRVLCNRPSSPDFLKLRPPFIGPMSPPTQRPSLGLSGFPCGARVSRALVRSRRASWGSRALRGSSWRAGDVAQVGNTRLPTANPPCKRNDPLAHLTVGPGAPKNSG